MKVSVVVVVIEWFIWRLMWCKTALCVCVCFHSIPGATYEWLTPLELSLLTTTKNTPRCTATEPTGATGTCTASSTWPCSVCWFCHRVCLFVNRLSELTKSLGPSQKERFRFCFVFLETNPDAALFGGSCVWTDARGHRLWSDTGGFTHTNTNAITVLLMKPLAGEKKTSDAENNSLITSWQ